MFKSKGSKGDPGNYRPVALLPSVSKVLERIIHDQTTDHLEEHNLLNTNQHAYRKHLSTNTALLQLQDYWTENTEKGDQSACAMIDMSAAFDCVDWVVFEDKLRLYKFEEDTILWFKSYLEGRKQLVRVGGKSSTILNLEAGVPQGSILGPLFYNLYTNELPETIYKENCGGQETKQGPFRISCTKCGSFINYADDGTYITGGKRGSDMGTQLEDRIKNITEWVTSNKLKINQTKTHVLRLITRQRKMWLSEDDNINIVVEGKTISPSLSERLLGGTVCENMTWKEHVFGGSKSVFSGVNIRMNALRKIRQNMTFLSALKIANGTIMSRYSYLASVWSGLDTTSMNKLQRQQNKAARIVTNDSNIKTTKGLLNRCNWMSIHQLTIFFSIKIMWGAIHHEKPMALSNQIMTEKNAKSKRRFKNGIIDTYTRPNLAGTKQTWKWITIHYWNKMKGELRTETKKDTFNKELKKWIKTTIPIHKPWGTGGEESDH